MKLTLSAHMIVKNEEQWIWYAIASVIESIDELFIYDTGSTDQTVKIITTFLNAEHKNKISFSQKGKVTPKQLVDLRNEQIQRTKTEWFLLLDGDEIWPKKTLAEFKQAILAAKSSVHGITVHAQVPVGDLFHYQSEDAGRYHILDKVGQYNIRGYRKDPKYHWEGMYPLEAYVDATWVPVQEKKDEILFLKNDYWHMTHMPRSKAQKNKVKYEIGELKKLKLPEVFFETRPESISSPWISFPFQERMRAQLRTPLVKFKRHFS